MHFIDIGNGQLFRPGVEGPPASLVKTRHDPRRCTVCRAYRDHQRARPPVGNWVKKLNAPFAIHLFGGFSGNARPGVTRALCGVVHRTHRVWTRAAAAATCRRCKRAAKRL